MYLLRNILVMDWYQDFHLRHGRQEGFDLHQYQGIIRALLQAAAYARPSRLLHERFTLEESFDSDQRTGFARG